MSIYKTAKGAIDLIGDSYTQTHTLLQILEDIFVKNGGEPLETPVFERRDMLLGKYGEEAETKLIYNLEENEGTPLALRYDLTIPFVRYIKENGVKKMRRYALGKVYRRDQPNPGAGRYREFYQADFDIFGEKQDTMLAEATLLSMASQLMNQLNLPFTIYINDIQNLKTLLTKKVNVREEIWKLYCPILDKLDKQSFDSLRSEFSALDPSIDLDQLKTLLESKEPVDETSKENYKRLCQVADVLGFAKNLSFTNSLARGLDYYTGCIWEVKIHDNGFPSSVIAGGRYDTLLGAPTVGISFGVTRLAPFVNVSKDWKQNTYISILGNIPDLEKVRIANQKRWSGSVIYSLTTERRKLQKIIQECVANKTRYLVLLAEKEYSEGKLILKDLKENTQVLIDVNT